MGVTHALGRPVGADAAPRCQVHGPKEQSVVVDVGRVLLEATGDVGAPRGRRQARRVEPASHVRQSVLLALVRPGAVPFFHFLGTQCFTFVIAAAFLRIEQLVVTANSGEH